LAGGAGARAGKDGASGITVNQSNAKIAAVEIIETEFPARIPGFELIADSGGVGEFRGGLGIRREYLNLADARFSIRSMKHSIPPNGCAGGRTGRAGDIWINPERAAAKRLPTRYADYPLRGEDTLRLDSPGRRRIWRSARARSRAGFGRRVRGRRFQGGGGARVWRHPSAHRTVMGHRCGGHAGAPRAAAERQRRGCLAITLRVYLTVWPK